MTLVRLLRLGSQVALAGREQSFHQSLSFLICKVGILTPGSQSCGGSKVTS